MNRKENSQRKERMVGGGVVRRDIHNWEKVEENMEGLKDRAQRHSICAQRAKKPAFPSNGSIARFESSKRQRPEANGVG